LTHSVYSSHTAVLTDWWSRWRGRRWTTGNGV